MKKLLLLLLCVPLIGFGQDNKLDEIIFSNGDTIYCNIIEIGVNKITYKYKGESLNNIIKHSEVAKISYASGRIQTFDGLNILKSEIEREEDIQKRKQYRIEKRNEYIRSHQDSPFKIGLEIGPSITSVRGFSYTYGDGELVDLYTNQTRRFSGGLSFEYSLEKNFSIRTNILYERKSAMQDITHTDISGNIIGEYNGGYNYDYLTIPILSKYSFGAINKFFINTGPYFSYLMKGSFSYGGQSAGGMEVIPDEVVTSRFNRFDVGLTFGFGGELKIQEKLLLTIEPRHNLGLTNIINFTDPAFEGSDLDDGFHNSINLLVGISYFPAK
jgi:hypothetical protein